MFVTFQSLGFSLVASFLMLRAYFFRPKCLTLRGHVIALTKFTVDEGSSYPWSRFKAEKRLLDIRVRQCSFTIAKLEEEYAKREAIVVSGNPVQNLTARNDVMEFLGRARSLAFEKHRETFAYLGEKKRSREHQRSVDARWVVNKSNNTLTTGELSVLEKRLHFVVTPPPGFPGERCIC